MCKDASNDDVRQILRRKSKPTIVKPASKQTVVNWVASAWEKITGHPDIITKSFVVVPKDKS